MEMKVNPSQIIQGGLAALVAWLFRTVQQLTNEVAVLKAEVVNANERLAEVITIVSGISGEINFIKNNHYIYVIMSHHGLFNRIFIRLLCSYIF